MPTGAQLGFQLDHALARDAVHAVLDGERLRAEVAERGLAVARLHSAVPHGDRQTYLRRPDLGRRLDAASAQALAERSPGADVVFVVGDGLSALAVERHALALLDAVLPLLGEAWSVGPVCVVEQARVAIGDEIGGLLRARMTVMLIGERPGLSSPDSLGVYLTWEPRPGRTDAERNCISNVRLEGMGYAEAARRIVAYLQGAKALGATGVALKDAGRALDALKVR